jgi:hypothetical protein
MVRKAEQDDARAEPSAAAPETAMSRPRWPAAIILLALLTSLAWSIFLVLAIAWIFGI